MMKKLTIADLFCGAGGTSTGAVRAAKSLGYRVELTAVNHWDIAVATHRQNHPDSRTLCASLDALNPKELYLPGDLDLLWASPECTHHSTARGGRPIHDQSRATAWCVVRWAEALMPPIILVENVPEFESWGGLGSNGRPLKSKKGETFLAWKRAIESLGYRVDHRILCAADYGDPTTRRRLFVMAVRGRRSIRWPEPTHAPRGEKDLLGERKPWVAAKEIIDWQLPSESIFTRKRPLSPNTLKRIEHGLRRFGLGAFLVKSNNGSGINHRTRSLKEPLLTVTGSNEWALCEPFILPREGVHRGNAPRSVDEPVPTVTASHGGGHLVEPFIVGIDHSGGNGLQVRSVNDPLTATTTKARHALAEPFIIPQHSGGSARSVNEPVPTVTTTARGVALITPFVVKFYGTGVTHSVNETLDTVTTKQRFGLAQPEIRDAKGNRWRLDVRFRMLQPHELSRAQGFPDEYRFAGNKTETVKQIGNAVPVHLTEALVRAALMA